MSKSHKMLTLSSICMTAVNAIFLMIVIEHFEIEVGASGYHIIALFALCALTMTMAVIEAWSERET